MNVGTAAARFTQGRSQLVSCRAQVQSTKKSKMKVIAMQSLLLLNRPIALNWGHCMVRTAACHGGGSASSKETSNCDLKGEEIATLCSNHTKRSMGHNCVGQNENVVWAAPSGRNSPASLIIPVAGAGAPSKQQGVLG